MNFLENIFPVKARGSDYSTEFRAGITTFVTMAYILPVNMTILSAAGLDSGAVFMATALAAVIGTILMGLMAGLPFALAPGMGLNAYFAYTVCLTMGYSPSFALAAVFVEGLIFVILSLTGFRTRLVRIIPHQLRLAIAAGIGMFIMFIGMQNAGIVIDNPATLVGIAPGLSKPEVCLALIGTMVTAGLWLKGVKGSLLLGILITWILGIIAQVTGWYVVDPAVKAFSLIPSGLLSAPPSLTPTFGLCFDGFKDAFSSWTGIMSFIVVTLTFLYVDLFDTLGTVTGVMTKANMVDSDGTCPGLSQAFLSDAIATSIGAVLGTSTTTTFVESAAGVGEGGRTGLVSMTVAGCFLLSIFFFPIVSVIPAFATAPALILVGIMMCEPMAKFEWNNPTALLPGVMTIVFMVVGYSISVGIMWGILFYLLTAFVMGKAKNVSWLMWLIGGLFLLKLLFLE